ncbi:MAG: twin-arginine translocation signal domain-containing protein [Gammaproteobacteria bacterium]|nr:twin-arginine translocation signal domain-containing protein [Gammaproteobacteria bacterium]
MAALTTDRRGFLKHSGAAAAAALSLKYMPGEALATAGADLPVYGAWEDVMRRKWTWDRVVRGSRGINCSGHCAFNIYVKNGIVWREEQQGEYGRSGEDTPDYGPRGCQKGIRHSKYMYGKQRVLYPMKRVGERGAGQWERVSWDQAISEIADKVIEHATQSGPDSITFAMGTQMILKRASFTALFRFANVTGIVIPETFAGVGDLPVGAYMTLGYNLPGDNMAAIYKSKCVLVWAANPAATRIPDAHFFWEAKYNGTEVVTIAPDFSATAIHSSKWLNPKPGTDTALAMAMVQTIIADGLIDTDYVREQTDLPFLVRVDNGKFLRASDFGETGAAADTSFYFWDEKTRKPVKAPATGFGAFGSPTPAQKPGESLVLNGLKPALEGRWTVKTKSGRVEVTTVFAMTRELCNSRYTPEMAQVITGVHADNTRAVARTFARSGAGMIYAGYRSCKWLHGDKLHRAWLLMCALTGNTGRDGGGMQTTQLAKGDGFAQFVFAGIGPRVKVAAISVWDYAKGDGKALNTATYGNEIADHFDKHYRASINNGWLPDYAKTPWKMAFMCGHNTANWRAAGTRFRETVLAKLETIVAMTPDMSVTAMYSDYVLPVAQHYERQDFVMEGRTPFIQVLDRAVPPLGESEDDWQIMARIAKAISEKAAARQLPPVKDVLYGKPIEHDYSKVHELFTMNGKITSTRDIAQFLIDNSEGIPKMSFEELAKKGFVRGDDSEGTQFGPKSPYSYDILFSTRDKRPYATLTGRQQFYFDHDWFLQEGEALPVYVDPLAIKGFPLRLTMGHARHGIHSMWRDDAFLLSLQRGEPDVYVNPDDAAKRGVKDGDLIRTFNSLGGFIAMAHVTSSMQPGAMFMYHGWDPMMFRGRQNFSGAIPTAGLLKPTSLVGNYGHIRYNSPHYVPNQTYHDHTVEFEKHVPAKPVAGPAFTATTAVRA